MPHGDVLTSMIGLLCLGKPDFEAVEAFRGDEFFRCSLGLTKIPSEGTLRQRLDELGQQPEAMLREESAAMVARHAPRITPCHDEWVAMDIDVSPFDNGRTKKEGVGWTYKLNVEGFAPNFAYLGEEGYLIHCELREGSQHCQRGTPEFIEAAIGYARRITAAKLLVRMDAGNDDVENIRRCKKGKVDYLIKRNLRKESLAEWLEIAQAHGEWEFPREGKEVYTGETWLEADGKVHRVVFEVTTARALPAGRRCWCRRLRWRHIGRA